MSGEEPSTEQLRTVQGQRAREESSAAALSPDEDEAAQHTRRAEKAEYLRDKLAERSESEREQPAEETGQEA